MKTYIHTIIAIIKINISQLITYRMSFINGTFISFGWAVFQLSWMFLMTSSVKKVFGWSRDEMMLLSACYVVVIGVFHFLFSRNFENLSEIIVYGKLDMILIKPLDTQFLLSFRNLNFYAFPRVLLGLVCMSIYLTKIGVHPTIFQIGAFCLLSICGLITLYSFWFFFVTLLIWFPTISNIVGLLYSVNGVARYPHEAISVGLKESILLFLLPLTFTIATPTRILFGRFFAGEVGMLLIITVIFFLVSRMFWLYSLRHYSSAGG